jgi:putative Mn2+ efflux pump MntP
MEGNRRKFHQEGCEVSPASGWRVALTLLLITLSLATSIDALAVGLSFAFLKVNIGVVSVTIGAVA